MAHIPECRYFAKLAREMGMTTPPARSRPQPRKVMYAFGHLDLLYPKATMTPASAAIAIDGETHEYTEMYPGFRKTAELEGNAAAVAEMDEQIEESKVHAAEFRVTLEKAKSVLPHWPRWKSATPTTTRPSWRSDGLISCCEINSLLRYIPYGLAP